MHIALENFANLPWTISKMEEQMGFQSDLVTLYRTFQNYQDEICLELPFVGNSFGSGLVRKIKGNTPPENIRRIASNPPIWRYRNSLRKILFDSRDLLWRIILRNHKVKQLIDDADIIVLDGGCGVLRSGKYIRDAKSDKIVEIFYGSDLRTRGLIPNVDDISELRFTMEYDHTKFCKDIEFLFFPFDYGKMPAKMRSKPKGSLRIGHSPTKRATKGTDDILSSLNELKKKFDIEIVLIEGLEYKDAIELKRSCDIFIDQLGELGYGISGLEAVAMGIPTMVQLMPDFDAFLGDHPFININKNNITSKITEFIDNEELFEIYDSKGKNWLKRTHEPKATVQKIHDRYAEKGWI